MSWTTVGLLALVACGTIIAWGVCAMAGNADDHAIGMFERERAALRGDDR